MEYREVGAPGTQQSEKCHTLETEDRPVLETNLFSRKTSLKGQ